MERHQSILMWLMQYMGGDLVNVQCMGCINI